jgi:hypothetical protein
MKKKQPQCGGGCLGAPLRALSRACDSACDLYVRGMSGCAHHVPSVAPGAVGRGGYGRSASSMLLRTSSDRAKDLVSAAARQSRRVAPAEVADATGSNLVPEPKAGAAAPKCQDSPGRSHPPPPALASIAAPCSALKLFAMRRLRRR